MDTPPRRGLGNRIAPPRFVAFLLVAIAGIAAGIPLLGWRLGTMLGFDLGALVFLASCVSLLDNEPASMRVAAKRNDANRAGLLGLTAVVTIVILVAVASELMQKSSPKPLDIVTIVATLLLTWIFSNMIYALHYAHMFYTTNKKGEDSGGLNFPEEDEPNYWDFVYFSFCLGMTFQTSDVNMTSRRFRRVTTFHCFAAFIFNLGILAFTINVLGGGS
jgi:uncharacterized membrane protein